MKIDVTTYYLELMFMFFEYNLAGEIDEKVHTDTDLILGGEKTRSTRKKTWL